jgi:hypothetical protein
MKLERIFACGCALVGATYLLELLHATMAGWTLFVALVSSPLVAGGTFQRLGSWRHRDGFASSAVALGFVVLQAVIAPSARTQDFGKLVLGSVILAGMCGLVMMLGAWVARRVFLDAPAGAPTLLVISTFVASFTVYFGGLMVTRLVSSSTVALAAFETGCALIAGIMTQRIAPNRHVVACGGGATVVVVWGVVAKLLRGRSIDLDFATFSDLFLVAAGFAGAAIGEKLRPKPRPSYAEFD